MAIISIANAKGGAGKTTVALLLAMEFARKGERVVLLDCDPLLFASRWHHASGTAGSISLISGVTFANLGSHLRGLQQQVDHIIIDLSGARDALVALAAGLSDLVLVPVQGCAMDAYGAAHVLDLIGQVENNVRSRIHHAVVLTRVSPLVTTRAIRSVKALLALRDVALLDTPVIERSAYRDMFEQGGTLYTMAETKVSNLAKAQRNMQMLATEVLNLVAGRTDRASSGPFARIGYKAHVEVPSPSRSTRFSRLSRLPAEPAIAHVDR